MARRGARLAALGALVGAVYLSSVLVGSVRAQGFRDPYAQIFGFWQDQPFIFGAHARLHWTGVPFTPADQWAAAVVGVTNWTNAYAEAGMIKWCDWDPALPGNCFTGDPWPRQRLTAYYAARTFVGNTIGDRAVGIPLQPDTDYTFSLFPNGGTRWYSQVWDPALGDWRGLHTWDMQGYQGLTRAASGGESNYRWRTWGTIATSWNHLLWLHPSNVNCWCAYPYNTWFNSSWGGWLTNWTQPHTSDFEWSAVFP